jgi:hypothetical protein
MVDIGQDRIGITIVIDHGLHTIRGLYHQSDDFGVLFLKAGIVGLQLTELRAARPSTGGAKKDNNHPALIPVIAQADHQAVGIGQ